jgi:hypothetical protein
MGFYEHSN